MQSIHVVSPTNSPSNTKSVVDLERFTREHASQNVDTLDEFAKYWNEFDSLARGLIEAKVLSKAERDLYFWTGLPYAVRKSIGEHLALTDLSYNERLIPTWRDVIQAGRRVFHAPSAASKQDGETDKLIRTLHELSADDPNYAVAYARLLVAAPTVADRIQSPSRWTRPPSRNRNLAVPHLHSPTSLLFSNAGNTPCHPSLRPTLRRVQSYVSYQWCPNCVDQHNMAQRSQGA